MAAVSTAVMRRDLAAHWYTVTLVLMSRDFRLKPNELEEASGPSPCSVAHPERPVSAGTDLGVRKASEPSGFLIRYVVAVQMRDQHDVDRLRVDAAAARLWGSSPTVGAIGHSGVDQHELAAVFHPTD
jgi:hypothetical protein